MTHNKVTPHYKIEQLIRREALPYTFLRPSFFMQNLSTTHRVEIAERGEIFIPAGRGKTNFVDVRYANPSIVHFCWRKWREGVPAPFILVMTALYTVARLGKAAGYAPDLQTLLGRAPATLAQFAEDYKYSWA